MLGAVAAPASAGAAEGDPAKRPNIVWFIADDPSPYLGAYGDSAAMTPTIDALADEDQGRTERDRGDRGDRRSGVAAPLVGHGSRTTALATRAEGH